jgi:hypothetical protein
VESEELLGTKIAVHEFSLRILPLAISAIVIATAIPIEVRSSMWWESRFDTWDFLQNLLLFVPLGIALGERRWWTVAAAAFVLSLTVETVQLWSFERFSSPYDVIANVLGAAMASSAWRRFRGQSATQPFFLLKKTWLFAALVGSVAVLTIWNLPTRSAGIADWDASFNLMLGNESTGDRAWRGEISDLVILSRALTRAEIGSLDAGADGSGRTLEHEALFHSRVPVTLDGGPPIHLSKSLAERLVRDITTQGAFTLIVRMRSDDLNQTGPARIVTFSDGTLRRNFDLGQDQGRLVFRVRTPVTGENAENVRAESLPVLKPQAEVLVTATYDGAIAKIFVNRELAARSNIAARGCIVWWLCDSAVPLAWSALGACFALIAIALVPWRSRGALMVSAMLAGVLALVLPKMLQSLPAQIFKDSWMPYAALVGSAVIAAAYVPPGAWEKRAPRPR